MEYTAEYHTSKLAVTQRECIFHPGIVNAGSLGRCGVPQCVGVLGGERAYTGDVRNFVYVFIGVVGIVGFNEEELASCVANGTRTVPQCKIAVAVVPVLAVGAVLFNVRRLACTEFELPGECYCICCCVGVNHSGTCVGLAAGHTYHL